MFGIGYQEMFILVVAALVIFGPGKLPEMAGQLGRMVRDFRRMTADLTGEFEKTIAEVDDVKRSVRREVKSMKAEVEGVSKSVKGDLEGAVGPSRPGGKTATATKAAAVKAGTASVPPATTGPAAALPVATKADPLADVSFLDDEPLSAPNGHQPAPDETAVAAATGSTDGAAVVSGEGAVGGNGASGSGRDNEALARVRRRRANAGYNRRP